MSATTFEGLTDRIGVLFSAALVAVVPVIAALMVIESL